MILAANKLITKSGKLVRDRSFCFEIIGKGKFLTEVKSGNHPVVEK